MAKINLLPWRAERRKQREREFYTILGVSAAIAVGVILMASYWMGMRVDNQNSRNTYLQQQIAEVEKKIKEIADLEKVKTQLTQRSKIIEQLYDAQSQTVHLFYELAVTLPPEVGLVTVKKTTDAIKIEGIAQSKSSVSLYMQGIDSSPYLGKTDLDKIETRQGNKKIPEAFSLNVKLKSAEEESGATKSGGAGKGGTSSPTPTVPAKPPVTAPGVKA